MRETVDDMYRLLSSIDDDPASVISGRHPNRKAGSPRKWRRSIEPIDALDRMTLSDALSYLTDDILQKVDRAAMSVSLETRVPFLDRDVAEFSCHVPPEMKVRNGQGKWLVRQVLDRHVPRALTDRPKDGLWYPARRMASWPVEIVGGGFAGVRTAQSPGLVRIQARLCRLVGTSAGKTQSRLMVVERPDGTGVVRPMAWCQGVSPVRFGA